MADTLPHRDPAGRFLPRDLNSLQEHLRLVAITRPEEANSYYVDLYKNERETYELWKKSRSGSTLQKNPETTSR